MVIPKVVLFSLPASLEPARRIFALQFLVEGLRRGEKGIYVAADEGPTDIIEQAASLGWDLEKHIEAKELAILNAGTYLSSSSAAEKSVRSIFIKRSVILPGSSTG